LKQLEAPAGSSTAVSTIAGSSAFKPMKFLHNGHAGPFKSASDIDIAGACFSLIHRKAASARQGRRPGQRAKKTGVSR
jgi:hypothetical protein